MIKFLLGVIVGILIFLLFTYFGGGKTVTKIGEGLTDTGKKIEAVEGVMKEAIKKETDETLQGMKKKILKEEKDLQKSTQ
jgi:hypothetical protein